MSLEKEILFVVRKHNILCLFHDQGGTKSSDVRQTKTMVPHTHTHTVVHGGRGVTRIVAIPLAMSLLRPSSTHRRVWYHGTKFQCWAEFKCSNSTQTHNERVGKFEYLQQQQQQQQQTHSKCDSTLRDFGEGLNGISVINIWLISQIGGLRKQ